MHYISPKLVYTWKKEPKGQAYFLPDSIPSICAKCNRAMGLMIDTHCYASQTRTVNCDVHCSLCGAKAKAWLVELITEKPFYKEIWTLPIPKGTLKSKFSDKDLPERLFKAYLSAIDCYNAGIYTAAINECGRVIEGITADNFPSDGDRKQLKELSANCHKNSNAENTLFKPILKLSSAIRLSRRSGSHFNLTEDPDVNLAKEVISLTEYAIEYFYLLEGRSKHMKETIERLSIESS